MDRGCPSRGGSRHGPPSFVVVALLGALLAACASAPEEPARESIDERTGTTVTLVSAPVQLLATQPRGGEADPFAFLAPFEINRMGNREKLLWLSVPGEDVREPPALFVDGNALSLEAHALDLEALALSKPPYASPAPWNTQFYYRLDGPAIERLASAQQIAIAVTYLKTGLERFATTEAPGPGLAEFARLVAE